MSKEQSWHVRPEGPGDAEGIDLALRRAFRGDNAADLVRRLRDEGGYDPGLSWVAVDVGPGGRILGHVLFSPIAVVRGAAPAPALALAPLGVLQDHQRMGIGSALVLRGLDACREHGFGIVLVLGDPGYYARFGFKRASTVGIEPPYAAWADAFQVLGLTPGALDHVRGVARYPDTFSDV